MSNYIRNYLPGGKYFFTLATHQRKPILCTDFAIKRLNQSFIYIKNKMPFELDAFVIMPDHLHCMIQLPYLDSNYSTRWNLFKRYFSTTFQQEKNHRREKSIWQKRFWEHTITDDNEIEEIINYIHYNPVKHGYVKKVCEWPHSSFHDFVNRHMLTQNWGGDCFENKQKDYGE